MLYGMGYSLPAAAAAQSIRHGAVTPAASTWGTMIGRTGQPRYGRGGRDEVLGGRHLPPPAPLTHQVSMHSLSSTSANFVT